VEILPGGSCIVESSEETIYKITIYGGLLGISDVLKELSLNSLQLSNLNFDYTLSNTVALADNDTSIVWLTMLYAERAQEIFPNSLDIRHSYFGIYIRTLLERVSNQVGIELIGLDTLTTPPLDDLVIPLSQVPQVSDEFISRRNFTAESSGDIDYSLTGQTVLFDIVIEGRDGSGDYDPGLSLYNSTEVFNLDVVYKISGTKTGTAGDAVFIISGTTDWYALKTISSAGAFSFELSGRGIYSGLSRAFSLRLEVTPGDTVRVNAGSNVNFVCDPDAVTFHDNSSSRGSVVDVAKSLPDISVWDIVLALRGIYALAQQANILDRTISIRRFEDINDVESVDWSEKLDISVPAQISYRSQGLGQINRFSYADDEPLNFEANGVFIVSDRNLPSTKDIQQLVFAASPVEIFQDFTTVKITLFDLELIREGTDATVNTVSSNEKDVVFSDDNARISLNDTIILFGLAANVIQVDTVNRVEITVRHDPLVPFPLGSTTFQVFRPRASNVAPRLLQKVVSTNSIDFTTGTSILTVSNPRVMTFVSRADSVNLSWSQFLSDNYGEYINRVQQEKILTAKFNLTEADIRGLNFLKSYYIATYGNFFYLNKVNKYRIDQSTECTLASLHFGFGGNEITEWFNGVIMVNEYEVFSSFQSNVVRAFQSTDLQTSEAESNDFEVVINEIYSLIYNLQYFEAILFDFTAQINVTTNFPIAGPVIFDNVLSGNFDGNYSDVTGLYTFNQNLITGIFIANMVVTDLPGGAGGTTVNLISDVQGVLDTVTLPNNTSLNFELSFQGTFALNEIVNVEINPTGDADVIGGSNFSFAYISGGNVDLVSDVNAQIFIGVDAASAPVLLEAAGADTKTLTINTTGAAKLRLTTLDAVDYSVSIRLEKQSAGG